MEVSRRYDFNASITAPFSGKGDFQDDVHRDLVLPIRERLMTAYDGFTGCYIARYGLEVKYLDNVIDVAMVDAAVKVVIRWASKLPGLFPLRGDKEPTVTAVESGVNTRNQWVFFRFSHSIVKYTPSPGTMGAMDEAQFKVDTNLMVKRLTDHNGIVGWDIRLLEVGLKFNSSITTTEAVEAHMLSVLKELYREGNHYFPYANHDHPIDHIIIP